VHDRVNALVKHLGHLDLATALDQRFAAGRGYEGVAQRYFFAETAAVDHIDEQTLVAGCRCVHCARVEQDTALVTVHGNKLGCRRAPRPRSRPRPPRQAVPGRRLPAGRRRRLASVKQLVRLGALHVAA
jgi:hypothetical protein